MTHATPFTAGSARIRETVSVDGPFCERPVKFGCRNLPELSVARIPTSIFAAVLLTGALHPAGAAARMVRVPNRYDGSWTIIAITAQGPCATRTRYQVRIKDSDASVPGREVEIDGGVSSTGSVQATITSGANRVPISGSLDVRGSGNGTWHTSGGLVTCTGRWSAQRAG
jgi:hypothetical protein